MSRWGKPRNFGLVATDIAPAEPPVMEGDYWWVWPHTWADSCSLTDKGRDELAAYRKARISYYLGGEPCTTAT